MSESFNAIHLPDQLAPGSELAERIYNTVITRADVEAHADVCTDSSEPDKARRRAQLLWTGLIALSSPDPNEDTFGPPPLGRVDERMTNYRKLANDLPFFTPKIYLGEAWSAALVNYCTEFIRYRTAEIAAVYSTESSN